MSPEERKTRAQIAANTRHRPNDPATAELARTFKEHRLAQGTAEGLVDTSGVVFQAA